MKFGHIAIRVKDINMMLDWWVGKFGLTEAFRIKNDDGSLRIVYLHISDGQCLEFCLGGDERSKFDDQKSLGVRHICFTVDDLADTKKKMEKRGIVFDSEIIVSRDNNKPLYLFDPEGNKVELVQIASDSPQFRFEKIYSK
jgi:lactoylglutathione lyase